MKPRVIRRAACLLWLIGQRRGETVAPPQPICTISKIGREENGGYLLNNIQTPRLVRNTNRTCRKSFPNASRPTRGEKIFEVKCGLYAGKINFKRVVYFLRVACRVRNVSLTLNGGNRKSPPAAAGTSPCLPVSLTPARRLPGRALAALRPGCDLNRTTCAALDE